MRRLLVALAFVPVPVFPGNGPGVPGGPICPRTLADLNVNASVDLATYRQNNGRWWTHYRAEFLPAHDNPGLFERRLKTLKRGDVVVDVGSGKAIAMYQLAGEEIPGIRAVAINAQDVAPFFDRVHGLGAVVRHKGLGALQFEAELAGSTLQPLAVVGGVSARDLGGLMRASGFTAPDWLRYPHDPEAPVPTETMARDLDAFAAHFEKWRKTAGVELVSGGALEKLRGREGTAQLLLDVYGAFFYGADRLELLEAYYATLAPGGVAFIALGRDTEYGGDVVNLPSGPVTLPVFLASKHEKIFEVFLTPAGKRFLVMEKPVDGPKTLSLGLEVEKREVFRDDGDGFVVPKLTMKEKR